MRATVVYINKYLNEEDKAKKLLSKGEGIILKNIVKQIANSAIRFLALTEELIDICLNRTFFADQVRKFIEHPLAELGLAIIRICITEVEENNIYSSDNIFDSQGIRKRTPIIQRNLTEQQEIQEHFKLQRDKIKLNYETELEQLKLERETKLEKIKLNYETEL